MIRRLIALSLSIMMVVTLVGCNNELKEPSDFGDRDTIGELNNNGSEIINKDKDKLIEYDTESYIDRQAIKFRDNIDIEFIKSIFSNNPVYKDLYIGDYEKIEYTDSYCNAFEDRRNYKNIDTVGLIIPFIYDESKDISDNITITISKFRSTDIVCEIRAKFIGSLYNIENTYGIKEGDILKSIEDSLSYMIGTDVASRVEEKDFNTTVYLDDKAEFEIVSVHNSPYGDTIDFRIVGCYNEVLKDEIEISTLPDFKIDYAKYFGEYKDTIETNMGTLPDKGNSLINMPLNDVLRSISVRSGRSDLVQVVTADNFYNYEINIPELEISESKFSGKVGIEYYTGNPKTYEFDNPLNTSALYEMILENKNGDISVFSGLRADADNIWGIDRELLNQIGITICGKLTKLDDIGNYEKDATDSNDKTTDTFIYTETINGGKV